MMGDNTCDDGSYMYNISEQAYYQKDLIQMVIITVIMIDYLDMLQLSGVRKYVFK